MPVDAGVPKKKTPKLPKPHQGSASSTTKPPPDDDDGLIQVNPHKK
jgi:hypothetical protein